MSIDDFLLCRSSYFMNWIIWCDMVRYVMIWYVMMWHMVWYDDMFRCEMIWYDLLWFGMVWYDTIRYYFGVHDLIWYDMIIKGYYTISCDMTMIWYVCSTGRVIFCFALPFRPRCRLPGPTVEVGLKTELKKLKKWFNRAHQVKPPWLPGLLPTRKWLRSLYLKRF